MGIAKNTEHKTHKHSFSEGKVRATGNLTSEREVTGNSQKLIWYLVQFTACLQHCLLGQDYKMSGCKWKL